MNIVITIILGTIINMIIKISIDLWCSWARLVESIPTVTGCFEGGFAETCCQPQSHQMCAQALLYMLPLWQTFPSPSRWTWCSCMVMKMETAVRCRNCIGYCTQVEDSRITRPSLLCSDDSRRPGNSWQERWTVGALGPLTHWSSRYDLGMNPRVSVRQLATTYPFSHNRAWRIQHEQTDPLSISSPARLGPYIRRLYTKADILQVVPVLPRVLSAQLCSSMRVDISSSLGSTCAQVF